MDRERLLAAAEEFAAHRVALEASLKDQLEALRCEEVRRIEQAAEAFGPRSRGTVTQLARRFGRSRQFINEVIVARWGRAATASGQVDAEELPATA